MNIVNILVAYGLSTVGGALLTGLVLKAVHRTVKLKDRDAWHPLHLWVGVIERLIATTLFVWSPKQLPLFIGGWVAAKIAAGWGRDTSPNASVGHFVALIANAVSFAVAIAAGIWLHPKSLALLNAGQ